MDSPVPPIHRVPPAEQGSRGTQNEVGYGYAKCAPIVIGATGVTYKTSYGANEVVDKYAPVVWGGGREWRGGVERVEGGVEGGVQWRG